VPSKDVVLITDKGDAASRAAPDGDQHQTDQLPHTVDSETKKTPFEVVRPDDVHIYPYLVGGLLHDSLNTLLVLRTNTSKLKREFQGGVEKGVLSATCEQLQVQLEHLNRVLMLLQTVSRAYYVNNAEATQRPQEQVEAHLAVLRSTYSTIRLTASMAPAFNDTHLPVGVLTFLTGEMLMNAARACAAAGAGDIALEVNVQESGRTLSLECRDSGPGFSLALLDQLLDGEIVAPRKLGTGGYGLYLMKEIVNRLKGKMLFSNLEPRGARVQILLPMKGPNR
jgi:K+-sensing histidine kinase KdpD